MADQFENQLPQKSDAKWVRALDASGNPILISKEDLASVVGELIGVSNSENNGLMPAGLFIKHPYTVYLDSQQSFEITGVNGFVGIRDGYSFGGIVLFFCTFGQVQQIKTGSYSGISLTFKDSTTLILKNTSSNRRGYQIFYQQIFF